MNTGPAPDAVPARAGKSHFWIETWQDTTGWRARAMHDDTPVRRCGISGMKTRFDAAVACAEKAHRRYGLRIDVMVPIAHDAAHAAVDPVPTREVDALPFMLPPDTLAADAPE